jgi:hypothetical protein
MYGEHTAIAGASASK